METCPLCWNSATASETRGPDGGLRAAKIFDCERCGRFEITEEQQSNSLSLPTDERSLLSAITRNATEAGGAAIVLTTQTARQLFETTPWPTAEQQNALFLDYLARKAKQRLDSVPVNHKTDYPLFFAKGERDVSGIARELIEGGFIQRTDTSAIPRYRLTAKGRQELDRLRAKPATATSPTRPPDALTGLPDKGTFETDFTRSVAEAEPARPLALLMIDADHFKKVNDTHGHAKGDEVLRELAQRLQAAVSGKGTAYRWGGEEMAALLPNHSLYEAVAVAERIRSSVAASPVAEVAVTVSIGVAVLPDHATDGAWLFKAADAAVYDSKKRGRNLVRYHGEPEPQADAPPAPHVTPRKQPSPHQLPDGWIEEARLAHFRGEVVRCPRDGAILKVERTSGFGPALGRVHFLCLSCGLSAQADGTSVESR